MSETVVLALYKGEGTFFDKAIRWRTDSAYSHCEIIAGSNWYTSSNRDGGVRRAVRVPTASWDYLTVPGSAERVVRLYSASIGQGYDWLGIAGHLVGLPQIQSSSRWTCSEWCAAALGLDVPSWYTPQRLYEWARVVRPEKA